MALQNITIILVHPLFHLIFSNSKPPLRKGKATKNDTGDSEHQTMADDAINESNAKVTVAIWVISRGHTAIPGRSKTLSWTRWETITRVLEKS